MKILFLDIDGVLNTGRWIKVQYYITRKPHSGHQSQFDPMCMVNLRKLVLENDLNIVISSTWRLGDLKTDEGWKVLMERLDEIGIKDRVIDITPDLSREYGSVCCRGHEIKKWLEDNNDKPIEDIVIIDDDSDMFDLMDKLAKCDFETGLTTKVKEKANEILSGGLGNGFISKYSFHL